MRHRGRHRGRSAPLLACALACLALSGLVASETPAPIEVSPPPVGLVGLKTRVEVRATLPFAWNGQTVEVRDAAGRLLGHAALDSSGRAEVEFLTPARGDGLQASVPGLDAPPVPLTLRAVPGWLSVVPPLIAILLALVFRQVVPALLAGVWVGAWIVTGDPFSGLLRTLDRYAVTALADADHASIIVFTMLLGGTIGVISRAGGTAGMVDAFARYATSSRRGQLVAWAMGVAIFFDDYANTLIVGNTMRPITDRLRISREKLAYLVDSTAAPGREHR